MNRYQRRRSPRANAIVYFGGALVLFLGIGVVVALFQTIF